MNCDEPDESMETTLGVARAALVHQLGAIQVERQRALAVALLRQQHALDVGMLDQAHLGRAGILAAIADRLMGRPFAQPVNTYAKDFAPGAILTYKPRGFPAALFSRSATPHADSMFNGKEMANAPMPANAAPDAATTAQPLRTPAATIRTAITKAYGKLLGQLESKGLVTLTQTEDEAIADALAAFEARARLVAGSLHKKWKIKRVAVNSGNAQPPRPMVAYARAAMAADAAPAPIEAGDSPVTVNVTGEIELFE